MPTPFLSSEEYDERAHQLYNEGQYDDALEVLREGLALYPNSVELHIGVGYARLAREEYAWARQSFEKSLVLDPDHEDALAGFGETLLKFGQHEQAVSTFRRILELGYADDIDLVLQVGRALFREELMDEARDFFEIAVREASELAEGAACLGYVRHRQGDDQGAIQSLQRALQLDEEHAEARIYLANILYDRGEYESALYHLEHTEPGDHWDELGIWRLVELKKSLYRLGDDDPELRPWEERLGELAGEVDDIDDLLSEIEARVMEDDARAAGMAGRGQLELFGVLLNDLADRRGTNGNGAVDERVEHRIMMTDGRQYAGSWERIVRAMRDANKAMAGRSLQEFMATEARRGYSLTGVKIPTADAESFIRGSASAGLLRIVR
ncbi:MAG TPA: tetratricopeptide repeat protein [Gemmatimonadaceae bacterium]|nr:tetratricopeptide repeat protein [Gemmatimonadaceae bacterium]